MAVNIDIQATFEKANRAKEKFFSDFKKSADAAAKNASNSLGKSVPSGAGAGGQIGTGLSSKFSQTRIGRSSVGQAGLAGLQGKSGAGLVGRIGLLATGAAGVASIASSGGLGEVGAGIRDTVFSPLRQIQAKAEAQGNAANQTVEAFGAAGKFADEGLVNRVFQGFKGIEERKQAGRKRVENILGPERFKGGGSLVLDALVPGVNTLNTTAKEILRLVKNSPRTGKGF